MPSGSGDNEVMRLILYSKNGYWPHYFIAVPCGVYQIFLSQVKTVSATDGFDFGKTNEKKFHVNATFVVKITETHESKIQIMIPTVTVTLLYHIHDGKNVIHVYIPW